MTTFKQKALEALETLSFQGDDYYRVAVQDCISRIEAIEEDDIEEIRKKANWYDESCRAYKSSK